VINGDGTNWGNQLDFKTKGILPTLTTNAAINITSTTATLGGNINSVGTPAYTERGVILAIDKSPIINNYDHISRDLIGRGTGNFTVNFTNLKPGATYYARAYAINTEGTNYGELVEFSTTTGTFNLATGTWTSGENNHDFHKTTWDGTLLLVKDRANITVTGSVSGSRRFDVGDGATARVTLDNCEINITSGIWACGLYLGERANLTLTLIGNNRLTAGTAAAGLGVSTGRILTIEGTGSLTARGGNGTSGGGGHHDHGYGAGAGIGGGYGSQAGTITINGGTITARGGDGGNGGNGGALGGTGKGGGGAGAGIGGGGGNGGCDCSKGTGWSGGAGGKVTITGGTVTATGGAGGSAGNNWGATGVGGRGGRASEYGIGGGGGGGGRGNNSSNGSNGDKGTLDISPNATVTISPPR